jgi:TonB family protein
LLARHRSFVVAALCLAAVTVAGQERSPAVNEAKRAGAPTEMRKVCAPTERDYPAASLRAGEQGTTRLAFKILPSGELDAVTVLRSSGFPRLDDAAMSILKSCVLPVKKDASGSPTDASYSVEFTWRLE